MKAILITYLSFATLVLIFTNYCTWAFSPDAWWAYAIDAVLTALSVASLAGAWWYVLGHRLGGLLD